MREKYSWPEHVKLSQEIDRPGNFTFEIITLFYECVEKSSEVENQKGKSKIDTPYIN